MNDSPQSPTPNKNPDIEHLYSVIKLAAVAFLITIVILLFYWYKFPLNTAENNVLLVRPLVCIPHTQENIEAASLSRCQAIVDLNTAAESVCIPHTQENTEAASLIPCEAIIEANTAAAFHQTTILDVISFSTLLGGIIVILLLAKQNGNFKDIRQFIPNLLVALVFACFIIYVFQALSLAVGLITRINPEPVSPSVAILGTGIFVAMVIVALYEWFGDFTIIDVSGTAATILVVGLVLGVIFTTNDWSGAISFIGAPRIGETPIELANGKGSMGLFRFTFIALGIMLLAYGFILDNLMTKLDYGEDSSVDSRIHRRTITWIVVLVTAVLIGMIGQFPYEVKGGSIQLHNIGSYGAALFSFILMTILTFYTFPRRRSSYTVKITSLWKVLICSILVLFILLVLGGGFTSAINFIQAIDTLEAEFGFLLAFLLFLHIYGWYFTETVDEQVALVQPLP